MQSISPRVLGRRYPIQAVSGRVQAIVIRQAQRRGAGGRPRGRIFEVEQLSVEDRDTRQPIQVEGVPVSFKARQGEEATLLFRNLGGPKQTLLALRNESRGKSAILALARRPLVAIQICLAVGWVLFWLGLESVTFDRRPATLLVILGVWAVWAIWYFSRNLLIRRRVGHALDSGPEALAELGRSGP